MRGLGKLKAEERGDSLVEFALSITLMLTAIFGVMDASRALFSYHFASYAAEEGVRYAIVRGSAFSGTSCSTTSTYSCDATSANIQSYVQAIVPPGTSGGTVTATATWPGTNPEGTAGSCSTTASVDGCLIKVKVTVPFQFIMPFIPHNSLTFTANAEGVTEQ